MEGPWLQVTDCKERKKKSKSKKQFALSAYLNSKMQLQILLPQFKAQLAVRNQYILGQLQMFLTHTDFSFYGQTLSHVNHRLQLG